MFFIIVGGLVGLAALCIFINALAFGGGVLLGIVSLFTHPVGGRKPMTANQAGYAQAMSRRNSKTGYYSGGIWRER